MCEPAPAPPTRVRAGRAPRPAALQAAPRRRPQNATLCHLFAAEGLI